MFSEAVCTSPKIDATQVFNSREMFQQNVVCVDNEISQKQLWMRLQNTKVKY